LNDINTDHYGADGEDVGHQLGSEITGVQEGVATAVLPPDRYVKQ
jgi:hypothetical protein